MSLIRPPVNNVIDARFPPLTVILGIPAVLVAFMLLLQFSGANEPLFRWLNGLSRYTGEPLWAHITLLGEGFAGSCAGGAHRTLAS